MSQARRLEGSVLVWAVVACAACAKVGPAEDAVADSSSDSEVDDASKMDAFTPPVDAGPFDAAISEGAIADLGTDAGEIESGSELGPLGPLVWSEGSVVRSAGLDGTDVRTFVTGFFPMGIAVDSSASKVYWTDNGTDTVSRASFDGSAREVVYKSSDPYSNPSGLALDAASNRMFWCETGLVRSAMLDGSAATTVIKASFPTAVAVDVAAKKLYFADNGTDSITRVSYDGSSPEVLYVSAGANPTAVAIDATAGRLYWMEPFALKMAKLDGTEAKTIHTVSFGTGIAIDGKAGKIYFSDNGSDQIVRANLDGSSPTSLYTNPVPTSNPRFVLVRPL